MLLVYLWPPGQWNIKYEYYILFKFEREYVLCRVNTHYCKCTKWNTTYGERDKVNFSLNNKEQDQN